MCTAKSKGTSVCVHQPPFDFGNHGLRGGIGGRQQGFSRLDSASATRRRFLLVGHFGCSSAVVLSVQNVSVHKEALVLIISSQGWRRCLKPLSSSALLANSRCVGWQQHLWLHLFFSLVFHLLPLCLRLVVGMRLISGILPD